MKIKEFGSRGGTSLAPPLDPPMNSLPHDRYEYQYVNKCKNSYFLKSEKNKSAIFQNA